MSIAAMSRVWSKSEHKGNALLLLLAIADNADDSGWCWPGIQYLAKKVKVTPQSIIRITKKLERSLELTVLHNRRTGNKYVIRLGMTDAELVQVLRTKAPYLDDTQITNILLHNACVTSEVTDNVSSDVTPVLHESSVIANESPHGADAPPAPADVETKHTVIETQPNGRDRVVERTVCKMCHRPIVPADEVYPGLSYCKCASTNEDKPPAYHCKHCGNSARVDTTDNLDTQGYIYCVHCGEAYFINEKPVTKWDIAMMQYLEWDCPDRPDVDANLAPARKFDRQCKGCGIWGTHEEIDDGHLCYECSKTVCYECFKPTATTPEMPYVVEVCKCKQEAALVEAFGDPPERPERKPPPHWHALVQEPWALWGTHTDEFQRQLQQFGDAGHKVQRLGYDWEQLTQLSPDWDDKAAIKSWSSGLAACLKAAGGDASIVLEATRKAMEDGLTIADPYSVVKVTRALCAKRKRGTQQRGGMGAGIVYA